MSDGLQEEVERLRAEVQEAAEALLRTHRILSSMTAERDAAVKENAALREELEQARKASERYRQVLTDATAESHALRETLNDAYDAWVFNENDAPAWTQKARELLGRGEGDTANG